MNSYLEIAERVLAKHRRPMGPRTILKYAYLLDLVPSHIHGKTQHKTLQARLSEDILHYKEKSRFMRTKPGKFFLRSLLDDDSIPKEYRMPMLARRRKRELARGPILCIAQESLHKLAEASKEDYLNAFGDLCKTGELSYFEAKKLPDDYVPILSFVMLMRDDKSVLSYRVGRYRTQNEDLNTKRTVGFTSFISENHKTLFNHNDFGIIEAGITALALDLDFPMNIDLLEAGTTESAVLVEIKHSGRVESVLLVFETVCPEWFEPTSRQLSMNDLEWISFRVQPNHLEQFDNYTKAVINSRFVFNDELA